jgi:hypothetical protein
VVKNRHFAKFAMNGNNIILAAREIMFEYYQAYTIARTTVYEQKK